MNIICSSLKLSTFSLWFNDYVNVRTSLWHQHHFTVNVKYTNHKIKLKKKENRENKPPISEKNTHRRKRQEYIVNAWNTCIWAYLLRKKKIRSLKSSLRNSILCTLMIQQTVWEKVVLHFVSKRKNKIQLNLLTWES